MCRNRRRAARTLGLALAATMAVAAPGTSAGGERQGRGVQSMKALRDANLVRQRQDFSCGAAALATLLRHGFGEDVDETDLLDDLFAVLAVGERDIRRDKGFSLLDLQRVAAGRGYRTQGFRIRPADLPKLAGPVIVYIEPMGYPHFAVLRGVDGDRVHLADPSQGNMRLPLYRFLERWIDPNGLGVVFVVEPADAPGVAGAVGLPMVGAPFVETVAASSRLAPTGARLKISTGTR